MKCIVCETDGARYRCKHCRSPYCSTLCFKSHRDDVAANTDSQPQGQQHPEEEKSLLSYSCEAILAAQAPWRAAAQSAAEAKALADVFSDASLAAHTQKPHGENDCTATTSSVREEREDEETGSEDRALKRQRVETAQGELAEGSAEADKLQQPAAAAAASSLETEKESEKEEGLTMLSEVHLRALANSPGILRALRSERLQVLLRTIDRSRSRLDALEAALFNNPAFKDFCAEVKGTIALAERQQRQ